MLHPDARRQSALSQAKRRLIAALVMAGDRGVGWDEMRSSDEPFSDEDAARSAFRMAVSRLRSHLPPNSMLDIGGGTIGLLLPVTDVDMWHLMTLATGTDPLDEVSTERLLHLLRPVEPLADSNSGTDLDDEHRRISDARQALMLRVAAERPDLLRGEFVEFLRGHLIEDPYNESLVATLVMAEAQAGDRRRALITLRTAQEEFADVGLELTAEVAAMEYELLDASIGPRFVPSLPAYRPPLPLPLEELRARPHVGHVEQLEQLSRLLDARRGQALVSGPSGVGKSRLCAELAHFAANRGMSTLYLRPEAEGIDSSFGPLLRTMPDFRARATPLLDRALSSEEARTLLMVAALEALAEAAGDGALLVIVDDSDGLDSGTAGLARQLPSTDVAARVVLVVVSTEGAASVAQPPLSETLADSPTATRVEVGSLTEADFRDMVRNQWPNTLEPLVWNLARHVNEMSRGRAGVGAILLASVPKPDRAPDLANLRGVRSIVQLVGQLTPWSATVGAAGAVLGREFDLGSLMVVTGCTSDEALAGIDELVQRQLLRERPGVRFEIVHALVERALLDHAADERIAQWQELAAAHHGDDIHRRALHQFAAGERVPSEEVLSSLTASALAHLATGAYWEAVVVFRKALILCDGGRLDLQLEGSFARALELSGLPAAAARVRERAVVDALAADDHSLALSIIVSGLPEAEVVDGDASLVDRLRRIDPSKVSRQAAHGLACQLSRQQAILGEFDAANRNALRARELAEDPSERIDAVFALRFAISCTSAPEQRCELLDSVEGDADLVDSGRRADYYMLQAIDCYENNRSLDARHWRQRLFELENLPAVRQWHGLLFDAMYARDHGELDEAARLRSQARHFGVEQGVNEAQHAHDVSVLTDFWLTGAFVNLRSIVGEGLMLDPSISLLHRAGAAAVLLACGEVEEAVGFAEDVAEAVTASPIGQRTAALAVAAAALAHSSKTDLKADVRRLFELRGRSSMVVMACATSLGPVANYMSMLATDDGQRRKFRQEAVEIAGEAGWPVWEAHNRAAEARETGDDSALEALRQEYDPLGLAAIIHA